MVMMPSESVFVRYIITIMADMDIVVLQTSYMPMVLISTTRLSKNLWDKWA